MGGPFDQAAIVLFDQREHRQAAREALAYAEKGGQALHVWDPRSQPSQIAQAPRIFREQFPWAHLIDHNLDRLVSTARRLGVRRTVVGREGDRGQHIDLCANPLYKAIAMAAVHAGYEDIHFEQRKEQFQGREVGIVSFYFAKPIVAH
jgi:hypothetical protein